MPLRALASPGMSITGKPQTPWATLTALREAGGLRPSEFATVVGITQSHLHSLESGRCEPTPAMTLRMAAALRVPVLAVRKPKRVRTNQEGPMGCMAVVEVGHRGMVLAVTRDPEDGSAVVIDIRSGTNGVAGGAQVRLDADEVSMVHAALGSVVGSDR